MSLTPLILTGSDFPSCTTTLSVNDLCSGMGGRSFGVVGAEPVEYVAEFTEAAELLTPE